MTAKQQRFVEEFLVDLNGTQAAIRAGYSRRTANRIASENLSKPDIQAAVSTAQRRRAVRTELTQDRVLQELAAIAFLDPGELFNADGALRPVPRLPRHVRAALLTVEDLGAGRFRVRFCDKLRALELLGKHLGLFKDPPRAVPPQPFTLNLIELSQMSDDDLEHAIQGSAGSSRACRPCPRALTPRREVAIRSNLTIHLFSFSYHYQGAPNADDWARYGGGHVFDCRGLPNPGRLPEYAALTGRDAAVFEYLRNDPAVEEFLRAALAVIAVAVGSYRVRGPEEVAIWFGCTGGQHRSVYCAEQVAKVLAADGHEAPIRHTAEPHWKRSGQVPD